MQDWFLYGAGALGVIVSFVHGYLGEVQVVRPSQAPSPSAKRVMQAIMFLSAVYWFAASVLLLITPAFISEGLRPFIVWGVAAVYASGSLANLWATRARHFGWVLLAVAVGLALAGI